MYSPEITIAASGIHSGTGVSTASRWRKRQIHPPGYDTALPNRPRSRGEKNIFSIGRRPAKVRPLCPQRGWAEAQARGVTRPMIFTETRLKGAYVIDLERRED